MTTDGAPAVTRPQRRSGLSGAGRPSAPRAAPRAPARRSAGTRPRLRLHDQLGQSRLELHAGRQQRHVRSKATARARRPAVERLGPGATGARPAAHRPGGPRGHSPTGKVPDQPRPGTLRRRAHVVLLGSGCGGDAGAHAGTSTVCVGSKAGGVTPWSTRWLSARRRSAAATRRIGHRAAVKVSRRGRRSRLGDAHVGAQGSPASWLGRASRCTSSATYHAGGRPCDRGGRPRRAAAPAPSPRR